MARSSRRTAFDLNRSYSTTKIDLSVTEKSILIKSIDKRKEKEKHAESQPDPIIPPDSVSREEPDTEVDIYGEGSNLREEKTNQCVIALRTIVNMEDDSEGGKTRRELLEYTRKVFPVYERWAELYSEVQEEKITEWKLTVTVLNGRVPAKDLNGKSDPYVRMGVIHKRHLDDRIVQRDYLTAWWKEKILISDLQNTDVIKKTLTPEWNEQKELKFVDPGSDVLVLEVWDCDGEVDTPDTRKPFLRDEFIGRAFLHLSDISAMGKEKELKLFSLSKRVVQSKKHETGMVKVRLRIVGVRKNLAPEEGLHEHKLLMKGLVNAESRTEGRYKRDWDGRLCEKAELLLSNHIFLVEMNEVQRIAIDLNVLIHYHRLFGVSIVAFLRLLLTLKCATDKWVKELLEGLEELLNTVIAALREHITKLQLQYTSEEASASYYQKLSAYIKVANELFMFHELAVYLEEKKQSVTKLVTEVIPLGVSDWFQLAKDKAMSRLKPHNPEPESEEPNTGELEPMEQSQTDVICGLEKLCSCTLKMCNTVKTKVAPIFKQSAMKIDFFSHFFLVISNLLSEEVCSVLNDTVVAELDEEATLKTFSCYISVKNIRALGAQPTVDWNIVDPEQLRITTLYKDFKVFVPAWIQRASNKCKKSIKKAVVNEEVKVVADDVKYSSSVVDAAWFLHRMFKVRDNLEWPVTIEVLEFTLMFMKEMIDIALVYVIDVFEKLEEGNLFDEKGQFKASPELGIILNDMWQMGKVFKDWKVIPLSPAVSEEYDEACNKLTGEMKDLLESFDREIHSRISIIVQMIIQRLKPDMERHLKELLDLKKPVIPPNYDKTTVETDLDPDYGIGSIGPLRDYLRDNFQILANILFIDLFDIILRNIWRVSLEAISALIDYITQEKKPNRADLHERLYYSLIMLKTFINSDGHGIPYNKLEDDNYKDLATRLDLLRQPIDVLILRFLHNLSIPQTERKKLGSLYITVSYLEERSQLEVKILQANDLSASIPSSPSFFLGLSACFQTFNPYVKINLLPHWLFEDSSHKTYKTSKRSNTHCPVYNEDFQLPASKEDLAVEGASLVFTVFNQSGAISHYSGMAIIPGKDLVRTEKPTLQPPSILTSSVNTDPQPVANADNAGTDDGGSAKEEIESQAPMNFPLPVFSYGGDCTIHAEIIERAQVKESRAVDFVKQCSDILKVCD